ncbi:unnamed protein product [Durusdinium trenchii]|uniref:Methyltransferase FkbM domain-containing protein n=1 Tax=Durusdinium trenchii TaxID=1381693 RepID=A0ABP0R884_9DINO
MAQQNDDVVGSLPMTYQEAWDHVLAVNPSLSTAQGRAMRGGDVKFMEVFGGVGSIAGEHVFDVRRNALHNIHTRHGLKSLLTLLLMVENVLGNGSRFVKHGNSTAHIIGKILIPICELLSIYWVVENPELGCPETLLGRHPRHGSFLRLLLATASVEDFVVVKVDIDGGPELAIVEAIAERPELARLVDELYFEYHFEFDFDFGWGGSNWDGAGRTVDTAMNLMHRLRQAGIRAHFWI